MTQYVMLRIACARKVDILAAFSFRRVGALSDVTLIKLFEREFTRLSVEKS